MQEFRYYCLHDDGGIALGEFVEATDLDAAINHAYEACRCARFFPPGPASARLLGIERQKTRRSGGRRQRLSFQGARRAAFGASETAMPDTWDSSVYWQRAAVWRERALQLAEGDATLDICLSIVADYESLARTLEERERLAKPPLGGCS